MFGAHRVVIGRRRGEAVQPNVANESAAIVEVGVHRVVIGRRRGEAAQPNVANECGAIVDVLCTSRGYRAPPRRGGATQRCERICCYS